MHRNIVENIFELWQPHPSGPPGFRGSFRHKIPRIYFEVRFLSFYTVKENKEDKLEKMTRVLTYIQLAKV